MRAKVKVIHYIGETLLKRLEMPLNGFICISLPYICVFSYLFIYVGAKVVSLLVLKNGSK